MLTSEGARKCDPYDTALEQEYVLTSMGLAVDVLDEHFSCSNSFYVVRGDIAPAESAVVLQAMCSVKSHLELWFLNTLHAEQDGYSMS